MLLLAAAAVAGWWWLRRKDSAAGTAAAGAGTDAAAKALVASGSSFGQVGSNFSDNVTPEIVKLTLDYAQHQADTANCWIRTKTDNIGTAIAQWKNTGTGEYTLQQPGEPPPRPTCGY